MKRIEINRLVTYTIFARLYPNKINRGVKVQYLYTLESERISEKNRIQLYTIEICGNRYIYLNDYALSLLNLTFEQSLEMINEELNKDKIKKGKIESLPGVKVPALITNNNDLYIE